MSYTQAEYRGRNDDGSESAATWKAAANTSWYQLVAEPFRVRARVSRASSVGDGVFAWQYSLDNATWVNMPAAGTASVPVRFAASAHLTDRAATTQQLGSGTFAAGRSFLTNRSGGIGMTVGSETEIEGCFELVSGEIASGASLYFRAVEVTDFVVELNTASQVDKTVRIPFAATSLNVDIDWGDGNTDTGVTTADPEHTYTDHGTYIVQVTGTARTLGNLTVNTRWIDTLVACHSFGALGLTSIQHAFRSFPGTSLVVPKALPSTVTNMFGVFGQCSTLTSTPDVSGWNTANVTNMYAAFLNCSGLTAAPNVSGWNTAKVTTMQRMFEGCSGISVDTSAWSVVALTHATDMYKSSAFSTAHYDALLIAWSAQTVLSGVPFHAGAAKYTPGGDAEAGKNTLVGGTNLWVITDGGPVV